MQTDIFPSTSRLEDIKDETEDDANVFRKEENEKCGESYQRLICQKISEKILLLKIAGIKIPKELLEKEQYNLQQRITNKNQVQTRHVTTKAHQLTPVVPENVLVTNSDTIKLMRRFKEIKRICFKKMKLKDISPYTTQIKELLKDIRNNYPESNKTDNIKFLAKQSIQSKKYESTQKPNQYMQMNRFPCKSRQEDIIDDANMFSNSKEDEKYSEYFRQDVCPVMLSDYSIGIIDKVCMLKIAGLDIPEKLIKKEQILIKKTNRFEIILAKRKSKKQQKLQERITKNNRVQTRNVDTKEHKLTPVVPDNVLVTNSDKINLMNRFKETKRKLFKKIKTSVSKNEMNLEEITPYITQMTELLIDIRNKYPESNKTACIKFLVQQLIRSSYVEPKKNETAQEPNQYTKIRVAGVFNSDIFPSTSRQEDIIAESEDDTKVSSKVDEK